MSSYVTSLDPVARDRYNEKLKLLDLSETEEPYELWKTDKFVDDRRCGQLWSMVIFFATLSTDLGPSQRRS